MSIAAVFFLGLCISYPLEAQVSADEQIDQPNLEQELIAEFVVVTELGEEIGAGGFDKRVFTSRKTPIVFFSPRLNDCAEEISQIAKAWAKKHGLAELRSSRAPGYLTLHYSRTDLGGIFLIYYSLQEDERSARLRFTMEHEAGRTVSGELVSGYDTNEFSEQLGKALSCPDDQE